MAGQKADTRKERTTLPPRRILLGDDHAIVLEGLRRVLELSFEIVGSVSDGRTLVAAAAMLRPDLIVTDISMPLLDGIEAVRQIRKVDRKVKIVFLSIHPDADYAAEALAAGGSAYVVKSAAGAELLTAIAEVLRGGRYVSPSIDQRILQVQIARVGLGDQKELTPRQREVLQLIAEGKTLKEVAALLKVSAKTVEFHKYRIMRQLGVNNNAEMTKCAVKLGLSSL